VKGEQVVFGVAQHLFDLGQLLAEYGGDGLELVVDVFGVGKCRNRHVAEEG
jgi:hypothetical protein